MKNSFKHFIEFTDIQGTRTVVNVNTIKTIWECKDKKVCIRVIGDNLDSIIVTATYEETTDAICKAVMNWN